MLVRVITTNPKTFRFASTGPYYVEIGDQRRISKASAQFFLDWVDERMKKIKLKSDQRDDVLIYHQAARKFWEKVVGKANAE